MNPFAEYRITSPFGSRINPITGKQTEFHTGIDLVKDYQAPIYAFTEGGVIHAQEGVSGSGFGGYGNVVAIRDRKGALHCYCHLYCCLVHAGDKVERGKVIGRQGGKPGDQGAGNSTGSHLHYEIRKFSSPSFGWIPDRENNCYEPTKYLQDYYAEEETELSLFTKIRVGLDPIQQISLGDYSKKGADVRVVTLLPGEWEAELIFDPRKTVEQIAVAHNADIAINGPFVESGGTGIIAYSCNGDKTYSYDADPKVYTRYGFAVKNGLPYIGEIKGGDPKSLAFKSSPLVVWDGKNVAKERMDIEQTPNDVQDRKPRPVLFIDKGNILTIAVVDGWTQKDKYKYDAGMTPGELGDMGIKLFNAEKGLNLDGGGSTTLYIRGQGVVNALQDGVQRAVGHALIFRKKQVTYKDTDVITYGDLKKLGLIK